MVTLGTKSAPISGLQALSHTLALHLQQLQRAARQVPRLARSMQLAKPKVPQARATPPRNPALALLRHTPAPRLLALKRLRILPVTRMLGANALGM